MANCNDCICSEVCYYKAFNDERILKKRRDDVEKSCKSFVHRDSFKNAPTVYAVEVVRCEKCKHAVWDEETKLWKCVESAEYDEESGEWFGFCEYHYGDYFCSYGERKDGDGNG